MDTSKLKQNFSKSRVWASLLFILSAIYLIYELAFNSRIVDGSTGDFSQEKMEALELQGRILSGIGLSLLCLKFISLKSIKSFMIGASATVIVAFSLMFFGQKFLIESLVDNSTKDDRINALHISLLKKGVMERHVVLEDLSIPEDAVGTPSAKAMMSIVGALSFNSADFVQKLKDETDNIIGTAAENDAYKTLPESYSAYQDYQRNINKQWLEYLDGVEEYERELSLIPTKAIDEADSVYVQAGEGFREKTSKTLDKENLIRTTLKIKRGVSDYFSAKETADDKCSKYNSLEQKCHIKIENTYRDVVISNAGKYVPPNYWCHPQKESVVVKKIRGREISSIELTQDCDSMSREWFEKKLLSLKGANTDISENKEVAKAVREKLSEKNIFMPNDWLLSDKKSLIEKFIEHGNKKLSEEYRKRVVEVAGTYIPPTLNQKSFVNLSVIQNPIKEQLNWKEDGPVPLNLKSEEFFAQIHLPRYEDPMHDIKNELKSESKSFENGGKNEEKGKNYYRSLIVPPFAMSFSLFFGLLNLFSFSATIFSMAIKRKYLGATISHVLLSLIFIAYPLAASSPAVKSDAFKYFSAQVNPTLKVLSSWVIDAQPIMYPIGNALASMAGQSEIEDYLIVHKLDETEVKESSYLDENNSTSKVDKYESETVDKARAIKNKIDSIGKATNSAWNKPIGKDPSLYPYKILSFKEGKTPANSLSLLNDVSESKNKGVIVDVSPIGDPEDENWVIYNSKIMKGDICVLGRKTADTLYHLKYSAWRSARHGSCDSRPMGEKLPTLGQMMRAINRLDSKAPVIVQLHEDLTGEVYCSRYQAVKNRIEKSVTGKEIIWASPSRSVLGCFANFQGQTAYSFPGFSDSTKTLNADSYSRATKKEWDRLKSLEKGATQQLASLTPAAIKGLLNEAPFISGVIIDERLLNETNAKLLKANRKWVIPYNNNGVSKTK